MAIPTVDEVEQLISDVEFHLIQNDRNGIIDGPRTLKNEAEQFQSDVKNGNIMAPSIEESKEAATKLFEKAKSAYGANSFRSHFYLSQIKTLENIQKKIPIDEQVYSLFGLDIHDLRKKALHASKNVMDYLCGRLGCTKAGFYARYKRLLNR